MSGKGIPWTEYKKQKDLRLQNENLEKTKKKFNDFLDRDPTMDDMIEKYHQKKYMSPSDKRKVEDEIRRREEEKIKKIADEEERIKREFPMLSASHPLSNSMNKSITKSITPNASTNSLNQNINSNIISNSSSSNSLSKWGNKDSKSIVDMIKAPPPPPKKEEKKEENKNESKEEVKLTKNSKQKNKLKEKLDEVDFNSVFEEANKEKPKEDSGWEEYVDTDVIPIPMSNSIKHIPVDYQQIMSFDEFIDYLYHGEIDEFEHKDILSLRESIDSGYYESYPDELRDDIERLYYGDTQSPEYSETSQDNEKDDLAETNFD